LRTSNIISPDYCDYVDAIKMLHQNSLNTFNTVDDYLIRFAPLTDFLFCILKIIIAACFRRCSRGFCFVHTVPECFQVFQYVSNMFRICSGLFRVIPVRNSGAECYSYCGGVPDCSKVFRAVPKVFRAVSEVFLAVPCCSGGVPGCSVLFRAVSVCSVLFCRCSVLFRRCSGLFRTVPVFRISVPGFSTCRIEPL
jgi:hypothetical protein